MKLTRTLALGTGLALMAAGAVAQTYPTRAITVIVPYAPGSTDTMARVLAEGMTQALGQPVVVETRPGAGGTVGAAAVAGAEPNGYTLLMAVSSVQTVAPHQNELPYSFDSLTPIARVALGPNLIAARAGAPFDTIEGFVDYARANPGAVSYGSAGAGGATHIAAEAIARAAGIELFHIPFPGVTPAIASTIAGDVDVVLGYASAILPQSESGGLVPLAQLSDTRTSLAPDLPTLIEGGIDLSLPPNIGYWAPAGTPDEIVQALAVALESAVAGETFVEFGRNSLTEIGFTGPEEFAAILAEEDAFFGELLPTLNLGD